jgi:hypothetical protein
MKAARTCLKQVFAVPSIMLKETTGSAAASSKSKEFTRTIPIPLVKLDGEWFIQWH